MFTVEQYCKIQTYHSLDTYSSLIQHTARKYSGVPVDEGHIAIHGLAIATLVPRDTIRLSQDEAAVPSEGYTVQVSAVM